MCKLREAPSSNFEIVPSAPFTKHSFLFQGSPIRHFENVSSIATSASFINMLKTRNMCNLAIMLNACDIFQTRTRSPTEQYVQTIVQLARAVACRRTAGSSGDPLTPQPTRNPQPPSPAQSSAPLSPFPSPGCWGIFAGYRTSLPPGRTPPSCLLVPSAVAASCARACARRLSRGTVAKPRPSRRALPARKRVAWVHWALLHARLRR